MPIRYDGKAIIPAPLVSMDRVWQRSADGTARQRGYKIVLSGKLHAFKGSPDHTGTFWTQTGYPPDAPANLVSETSRLALLRDKLDALIALFDTPGQWLEIQPYDNSAPIKCRPRVQNIRYDQGAWFEVVNYQIELEADIVWFGTYQPGDDPGKMGQLDNPPEESWSLEMADEVGRTYRLTHSVAVAAKQRATDTGTGTIPGWKVARALVLGPDDPDNPTLAGTGSASTLGFHRDQLTQAGILNLADYEPFNYVRSTQTDEAAGSFRVSESWLCYNPTAPSPTGQTDGKALEDCYVDSRYSNDTGRWTVTVNGTVTGFEERDPQTRELIRSRWDNAALRFNPIINTPSVPLTIAQEHSGKNLNPVVLSSSVVRNKISGVIQWSVTYDTRIAITEGYLAETYEAQLELAADVFAQIGVVGSGDDGPVLQDIGSKTAKAITVSASILLPTGYGQPLPVMPNWNPLAAAISIIGVPRQIFCQSDRVTLWNQREGRYSRTATYVYK